MIRMFFLENINCKESIIISGRSHHYIRNVMRVKEGQDITLFNNESGSWLCKVINIGRKETVVQVLYQVCKTQLLSKLSLCFAVVKSQAVSNIVRQSTEMDIGILQPIITERTVIREVNEERLRHISIEASEQSERDNIPEIRSPISFYDLVQSNEYSKFVLCDETHSGKNILEIKDDLAYVNAKIAIIIGPEGGFTQEEITYISEMNNILKLDLGNTILKCDTAAVAAISLVKSVL